jgi:hypothetical protein
VGRNVRPIRRGAAGLCVVAHQPIQGVRQVPRQTDDHGNTIFSAEERVWAILVGVVLLGVELVLDRTPLGDTTVGRVLAPLVGVGIFSCLWIAVVGRASNDP